MISVAGLIFEWRVGETTSRPLSDDEMEVLDRKDLSNFTKKFMLRARDPYKEPSNAFSFKTNLAREDIIGNRKYVTNIEPETLREKLAAAGIVGKNVAKNLVSIPVVGAEYGARSVADTTKDVASAVRNLIMNK